MSKMYKAQVSPSAFQRLTGVRYLPTLEFYDEEAERFAKVCWKKKYLDRERQWLGEFHGPAMEQGKVAPLSIQWIDEVLGFGVFAAQEFRKGDYLGAYTGRLIRRDLLRKRVNDYCFRYPVEVATLWPLMIDAGKQGNEMRFINHSAHPNCETIGVPYRGVVYLLVRAAASLSEGTQLTIDYGPAYWRGRERSRLLKRSSLT